MPDTLREKVVALLGKSVDDNALVIDVAGSILALFEEDRKHYTTDGYCWFRDKWEESEDRCAKLVEALRRLYVCCGPLNDEVGEEWQQAHWYAGAALATAKEEK